MKRKYIWRVLLGLLILFMVVSCKSKPAPQEETTPVVETPAPAPAPADTTPDQASLDALNKAAARAAEARKVVMDFGGPSLSPDDWQSADSLYTQAEQQKSTSTRQAVQDSTARYVRASAAFEQMTDKTYAAAYDYAVDELTAARNAVVSAGAEKLIPDYLLEVDNTVADAQAKYQAKDYYSAKDAALKAYSMYEAQTAGLNAYNVREDVVAGGAEDLIPDLLGSADNVGLNAIDKYLSGDYNGATDTAGKANSMYVALKSGLDAYKVREEISDKGFDAYDPQNFGNADDMLKSAADDYTANSFDSAKDKADQALVSYNLALQRGWESYAAEMGSFASTERQKALDLKANVAVRDGFNSAQTVYNQANSAFQAKKHEDAASLYKQSQSMFTDVAQTAREKRQAAENALNTANQKITESDEKARNAESILQGGM